MKDFLIFQAALSTPWFSQYGIYQKRNVWRRKKKKESKNISEFAVKRYVAITWELLLSDPG